MCTLSLVPRECGFLLAINRDEQRTRSKALPPAIHRCGDLDALYPREPGGGTWIGINEAGLCAALINWYARPQLWKTQAFSRGEIIPRLLVARTIDEAEGILSGLLLPKLNPFRLILIRHGEAVREFRSDTEGIELASHDWGIRHWFSSGHDEKSASRIRGETCRRAHAEPDVGTLLWLRRLHASHDPEIGADSICVHRDDALTVSLTILESSDISAAMCYADTSPCELSYTSPLHRTTMKLLSRTDTELPNTPT